MWSPHPPRSQVVARRLEILASDGTQRLTTSAELTQTGPDRLRPTGRWLVVIGALLVLVGALVIPWRGNDLQYPNIGGLAAAAVSEIMLNGGLLEESEVGPNVAEASLRILLAVFAVIMLVGLAGNGGPTRKAAILVLLLVVVAVVAPLVFEVQESEWRPLDIAILAVGAVLAYIGGLLIRRT